MTSKESRTLRFTLSAEVIGNENATHSIIGEFIMPLDASDDLVCSVHLPGDRLGGITALAARIACQSIDKALKKAHRTRRRQRHHGNARRPPHRPDG